MCDLTRVTNPVKDLVESHSMASEYTVHLFFPQRLDIPVAKVNPHGATHCASIVGENLNTIFGESMFLK